MSSRIIDSTPVMASRSHHLRSKPLALGCPVRIQRTLPAVGTAAPLRLAIATGPDGASAVSELADGLAALGHEVGADGDDVLLFDGAAPAAAVARLARAARVAAVVRGNHAATPAEDGLPLSVPV